MMFYPTVTLFFCHFKEAVGPDSMPGYQHVTRLADHLVALKDQSALSLSNVQANEIITLWQRLSDYDKQRIVYSERFQRKQLQGRFKSARSTVSPGVESTKRFQ